MDAKNARADSVLVLNSEEASYSILSRSGRTELVRLPVGGGVLQKKVVRLN